MDSTRTEKGQQKQSSIQGCQEVSVHSGSKEFCKVGGGVQSVFWIHPNIFYSICYFVQDTKPIWKHWVVISRVPLPISSSPLSVCFYFAKFAERDADNDGAASGAESTGGSGSI